MSEHLFMTLGFPTIDVNRDYNDGSVTFTQTKFQILDNATTAKEYETYSWWVPISYASSSHNADFRSTKPDLWMKQNETTLTSKINATQNSWMIVNVQQTGTH